MPAAVDDGGGPLTRVAAAADQFKAVDDANWVRNLPDVISELGEVR